MNIPGVDFKVQPVEAKGLYQAEDSFSKKSVDPNGSIVLVEQGNNRIAENQGHEGISSFRFVFNVHGRKEVEEVDVLLTEGWMILFRPALYKDHGHNSKQIYSIISDDSHSNIPLMDLPR